MSVSLAVPKKFTDSFVLRPSLSQFLVSRADYLQQLALKCTRYDKLVVGVAVLQSYIDPSKAPRVLVLRRTLQEDIFPGVFELPGGHVEDTDESILHAVVRELFEETGLAVKEVISEIPPFEYSTTKTVDGTPVTGTTLQLNFVVEPINESQAGGTDVQVTINPLEHDQYAWVDAFELQKVRTTEEMRKVILDALQWAENHRL